jgi:hypothetical protein
MTNFKLKNNIRYSLEGLTTRFGSASFIGAFNASVCKQTILDIRNQIDNQISISNAIVLLVANVLLIENIHKKVSANVEI